MTSKDLLQALVRYGEAAFGILGEHFPPHSWPQRLQSTTVFNSGTASTTIVSVLDTHLIKTRHWEELQRLPEMSDVIAAMPAKVSTHAVSYAESVVLTYLERTKSLRFSASRFQRHAENYIAAWRTGRVIIVSECLLTGLVVPMLRPIRLGEGIIVRSLTDRLREDFASEPYGTGPSIPDLLSVRALLEIRVNRGLSVFEGSNMGSMIHAGAAEVERAVMALRLAFAGPIGIRFLRRTFDPQPRWIFAALGVQRLNLMRRM